MIFKPAKFVVYPAKGLLGVTNAVVIRNGDINAIRAMGATEGARFDLAVEIAVGSTWGEQSDIARRKASASWDRNYSRIAA